jgi:hypothetical protein
MEVRISFERVEAEDQDEQLSPGEIKGIRAFFDMMLRDPNLVYRFGEVQIID